MIDQKILGQRIKSFRKRSGISQFTLESLINASPGYLSRIENGEINPTKETIMSIAEKLKLRDKEIDYLTGKLFYPATKEEINEAIDSVREYFSRKGLLACLVDDRNRFIYVTDTFIKLLKIDTSLKSELLSGKTFIEIILDERFNIIKNISPAHLETILYNFLKRWFYEVGFMIDDPIYERSIEVITSNSLTSRIWERVVNENEYNPVQQYELREVVFNFNGINVPLNYSDHILLNHRRFEVVEYASTNRLLKFLSSYI